MAITFLSLLLICIAITIIKKKNGHIERSFLIMNKKTKNTVDVYISNIGIASEEEQVIPPMVNCDIICSGYLPLVDRWVSYINTEKIRKDTKYSEFQATFIDCIRELQITEYNFCNTDIRLEYCTYNAKKHDRVNILLVELFNMLINETENYLNEVHCSFCDNEHTYQAYNSYWGMSYTKKDIGDNVAHYSLELANYKATKKGGRKPHELKEIWFKKLDQLLVIYEYMKIRRYNAGDDFVKIHELLIKVSLTELKAHIEKIKVALNEFFSS